MANSIDVRLTALEADVRKQRGVNSALKARLKRLEEPESPAAEEPTEDK